MSKVVKCNHELVVILPESDEEHIKLVEQVTKLFSHLKEYPDCIFRWVQN